MALGLALVLSACGGEDATSVPPTTASNPAQATSGGTVGPRPAGAATATPPVGTPYPASNATVPPSPTAPGALKPDQQILNLALSGEVNSFDPALSGDTTTFFVLRQIYSGLLSLDKNLMVVPDLAAKMPDLSENGTLYTFTLREGAKFQSGREITADDFKYSLERAADPKLIAPDLPANLPAATYMSDIVGVKEKLEGKATDISGVRVKDKSTLQIKLDAAKPQFLAKMTQAVFYVVNKDNKEVPIKPDPKDTGIKTFEQLDGSGPFKPVEFRRNEYIKLARNANYYLGPPRLAQVNFAIGASANNPLTQYEQGKLDMVRLSATAEIEKVLDKASPLNQELVVKSELDLNYLGFNVRARPFDDPKVRQAFSLVVDRPRLARAMFENKVQPATGLLPPGMPGYNGKPGPLNYDISRARDLIAQSSYRSPANLPRIILHSTGDPLGRVFQEVYKQAFGIEIEVRQYDYKAFQDGLSQRQFQMFLYSWKPDYPDPEGVLRSLLGSSSPYNDTGYSSTAFDDLLKQADQQTDLARRLEIYPQAEQQVLGDAPILPIYHSLNYSLVKPYLKGLNLTELGIWTLKDAYVLR